MNAAVMKQRGLGDGAFGLGRADGALSQWSFADLLNSFEAVAFGAFVFVEGHRQSS